MEPTHIGFRVLASPAQPGFDDEVENFEIRQAAIDCAQLLDSKGWKNVRCVEVNSRPPRYPGECFGDAIEEFTDIEWQCHQIGA